MLPGRDLRRSGGSVYWFLDSTRRAGLAENAASMGSNLLLEPFMSHHALFLCFSASALRFEQPVNLSYSRQDSCLVLVFGSDDNLRT